MSFGLRDIDWVDPPEEQSCEVRCCWCCYYHECPCRKHGWCDMHEKFVSDEAAADCNDFEGDIPYDSYLEDYGVDLARDRAMEGWN